MDREAFVQAWLNTEEQVPVDLVQFDFLPDPESENWFEAAALNARDGWPALHLQAIFGLTVISDISMGNGDVIGFQYANGRRNVLWVHDYLWGWAHGGSVAIDPDEAEDFMHDWWDDEGAFARAVSLAHGAESATQAFEAIADNDELTELVTQFVKAFDERFPEGDTFPDFICGSLLSDVVSLFTDREPTEDAAKLGLFNNAAWICDNLIGHVNLPGSEHLPGWEDVLKKAIAEPTKTGPATALKLLWAAYFTDLLLDEMIEVARQKPWRVLQDAVSLVERLREDPQLGDLRLVTCATLHEKIAAEQRAVDDAATSHQQSLDAGNIVLEPAERAAPKSGVSLVTYKEVPEHFAYRFAYAGNVQFEQPDKPISPREWLGQTSSGVWVGVRRTTNDGGIFRYEYMSGAEEPVAFEPSLEANQYRANPHTWVVRGDHAYAVWDRIFKEIDLRGRTTRTLISWEEEGSALTGFVVSGFAFVGDTLWTTDFDHDTGYVRRSKFTPGGALEPIDAAPIYCSDIAYDEATKTVAIFTMKHGMWFLDEEANVFFRIDLEPKTTLLQNLRFSESESGLFFANDYPYFQIVNLENADRRDAIPLAEIADDLDRVADITTDFRT